jgi:hypothetical protein
MKIQFIKLFFLGTLLLSCDNKKALTYPLTVKGMRLGLDGDEQVKIATKNNICENDFGTFDYILYTYKNNEVIPQEYEDNCQYRLNDHIFVKPISNYGYLDNKKVLSTVTLLFHSPKNYRFVTSIFNDDGKLEFGRPSISWDEALEIISIYEKKYGKGSGGNTKQWIVGDLCITLRIVEYIDLKEKGVCQCIVNYEYIKEIREKIVYEDIENSSI